MFSGCPSICAYVHACVYPCVRASMHRHSRVPIDLPSVSIYSLCVSEMEKGDKGSTMIRMGVSG